MIRDSLSKLVERKSLSDVEMRACVSEIMMGEATPGQIGAFLAAMRMKPESAGEIASAMMAMRKFMVPVKPKTTEPLLDIVGTGGDAVKTFNVSTCAAIIASAAGCKVAKHGNRSFTSKCGSADVLEALGVKVGLDAEKCAEMIDRIGIAFMFAPTHHPAMKFAGPVRKEIGFRTIFNLLGPLTNPAMAQTMVVGVYEKDLVEKTANVLKNVGVGHALVLHGLDGLDEFSNVGQTFVAELSGKKISTKTFSPKDFGFKKAKAEDIAGGSAEENAKIILAILSNEENGAKLDIVLFNAGAGIFVNGKAKSIKDGIAIARSAIESGAALRKLEQLKGLSNR